MQKLAAIDVGTNSIRLLVVNVEADHSFTVLTDRKETVRLGEGEFARNRMTPEAMDRAITVIARFADVARGYEVNEVVAVATSAVREAENRHEFLERVLDSSGLSLEVISGVEEARLVYLGVSSGTPLDGQRAMFVDVGGGSTEIIAGDRQQHLLLDSLKLGTIRITNRFLGDGRPPVSRKAYSKIQEHIRGVAVQMVRKVRNIGFHLMVGSSGSIINLGEMAAELSGERLTSIRHYALELKDLKRVREMMCKAPLDERRKLPGIKPERADILIGGAAIVETLMEMLDTPAIYISERGLREGLVIDWILRDQRAISTYMEMSPRVRSVIQLARGCGYDAQHTGQVKMISLSLFDRCREMGLHRFGPEERELLEYAALLHDVGFFLSHTDHHRHSYYIIRNSELLGFNDREQAIIANLALYHRKALPRKKHPGFAELGPDDRELVTKLSAILRIAEGLDRSHLSLVRAVHLERRSSKRELALVLESEADCQLELWGIEAQVPAFGSAYGVRLQAEVRQPQCSTEGAVASRG